jgi:23S rRNA U2552 (ribose-2'-O)-methylase RlmE/FtsJ
MNGAYSITQRPSRFTSREPCTNARSHKRERVAVLSKAGLRQFERRQTTSHNPRRKLSKRAGATSLSIRLGAVRIAIDKSRGARVSACPVAMTANFGQIPSGIVGTMCINARVVSAQRLLKRAVQKAFFLMGLELRRKIARNDGSEYGPAWQSRKYFSLMGLELHRKIARNDGSDSVWQSRLANAPTLPQRSRNTLEQFFDARTEGRGIWKWRHYFEIYDRHFSKFVGKDVHMLEIGIYSGGSLEMWKHYFGPRAHIYGVDIQAACKFYEDPQTKIFIGDQADRSFWQRFKQDVPKLDIVVDDGGHEPHQQMATMEALLPHLRPGGVFLCEFFETNPFAKYALQFARHINAYDCSANLHDQETRITANPTPFQQAVHSIHLYPMVLVIERRSENLELVSPKHGTQWQPFIR